MRVARPIVLNPEQKEALEQCARARSLSVRLVERARIVLLAAAGMRDKDIAEELGITAHKASRWRKRFLAAGMVGLEKDAPRPGRTLSISAAKVRRVIQKTTQEKPAHATHWSTRTMAAAVGLSEATVRRIWHKHGLKPHLVETFKVSTRMPTLPRNWRRSSGYISIHPSMPWGCVATRRVRFRPWTARSLDCR
jgi:transposase